MIHTNCRIIRKETFDEFLDLGPSSCIGWNKFFVCMKLLKDDYMSLIITSSVKFLSLNVNYENSGDLLVENSYVNELVRRSVPLIL